MSQPFEQKYKQVRMNLTNLKVRYDELNKLYQDILTHNYNLREKIIHAELALFKAGWRRLDDFTWTNEPLEVKDE